MSYRSLFPAACLSGLFVVLALTTACSTDVPETDSTGAVEPPALRVAPGKGAETPGFAFLAPLGFLGPRPSDADFDGSLLSKLRVEVCEWSGSVCRMPLLKTFAAGTGLSVIDAEYRNLYRAFWQAPIRVKDLGKIYRIRVLIGSTELGYADLELVRWLTILTDGEPLSGGGKVGLGAIVPIRFYVARGAVTTVTPAGGVVSLAGGNVELAVPPGAVAAPTAFSATPATDLPVGGPPVLPGTAWDFGPDGIAFAHKVTMTIRYDPALLPPGTVEGDLRIHKLVAGQYLQQPAGVVDLVNKTVSAEVESFSVYVILPRVPGREEDLAAPIIRAIEVLDPATGTWSSTAAFDVSAAAATVRLRATLEDDISGGRSLGLTVRSPSGLRALSCFASGAPTTGSDTFGTWECQLSIPRSIEPGSWWLGTVSVSDRTGNGAGYSRPAESGLLCRVPTGTVCLPASLAPVLQVLADPWDDTPPVVDGPVEVSPDVVPRMFGPSASITLGGATGMAILRIPFAEDFSAQPTVFGRFDRVGGGGSGVVGICFKPSAASILECQAGFPGLSLSGTYLLSTLELRDGATNASSYTPQPDGRLCTPDGASCLLARPSVEVTGSADGQAPFLHTVSIGVNGSEVTTSFDVTDDQTGISGVLVTYVSATSTQSQLCSAQPSGAPVSASLQCTITFPAAAARGQWALHIRVIDMANNQRNYNRRASDGFLCYQEGASGTPVCQDFGTTELLLP